MTTATASKRQQPARGLKSPLAAPAGAGLSPSQGQQTTGGIRPAVRHVLSERASHPPPHAPW